MPEDDGSEEIHSFCRICTAMCGITVTVAGDRVLKVRGDHAHPLSGGYTCPKGRALPDWHHHPHRLDHPRLDGRTVDWDRALENLSGRLSTIIDESGPDAVAMYLASGSAYDANGRRAAERFLTAIGSRQKYTATTIDTPMRPLVAELMGGWSGLTPMWDQKAARLLILVGTNPVVSHGHGNGLADPVRRLRTQQERGPVWVIDPRRTETAQLADRRLAPRPGTDHLILGWLVREILAAGADRAYLDNHATGTEELAAAVAPFTLDRATAGTGLDGDDLLDLLGAVRTAGRLSVLSGTGVSMGRHANVTEWLLWALAIVTGSYDRPGGMWFNPGYLMQLDARSWQPSDGRPEPGPASRPELPRRFGEYPCAALVSEIEAGNVRALMVVGGNPLIAFPDRDRTRAALASLDVLAVADVVETDTTGPATHLLPVAGQLERADLPWMLDAYQPEVATQYTPAVVPPGADRRLMWRVFARLGRLMGVEVLPRGIDPDAATDEDLLALIADRGRRDAATVLGARRGIVDDGAPVHGWVLNRVLPDRRWKLAPEPLVAQLADLADSGALGGSGDRDDPAHLGGSAKPESLVLVPRRQMRTMNGQLRDLGGVEPEVLIHPDHGFADGQPVRVRSAHGELVGLARTSDEIAPGAVSIPHGWADPNVCTLTTAESDLDPLTGMVRQSGLPVDLSPA